MKTQPLTTDHATCDSAVEQGARYLAETLPSKRPAPLIPALRNMFGLSATEVCEAIRLSHEGGADAQRP